jgi:membrane fusion protein, multidrug efflux system
MQEAQNDAPIETAAAKSAGGPPRKTVILVLAVVCLTLGGGGLAWWWHLRDYETTDNAFIAANVSSVSPQVAGRVAEVLAEDNQRVKAGDVLVRLDADPFRIRLEKAQADLSEAEKKHIEAGASQRIAQAALEQAKADAGSAEAQAANAATDNKRYGQLVEQGAVSVQARDTADTLSRTTAASLLAARKRINAAESQVALAEAQIATAQAGIEKARAAQDQAALDLTYTEVKAGVSGRVTKKAVETGDYVQVGQAVCSLVTDAVWVLANFKENQLRHMRPGQEAVLRVDTYSDLEFTGRVDSIQAGTGAAFSLLPPENASGNYVKVVQRLPVKIVFVDIPGDGLHLAPGMSVVPRVKVR